MCPLDFDYLRHLLNLFIYFCFFHLNLIKNHIELMDVCWRYIRKHFPEVFHVVFFRFSFKQKKKKRGSTIEEDSCIQMTECNQLIRNSLTQRYYLLDLHLMNTNPYQIWCPMVFNWDIVCPMNEWMQQEDLGLLIYFKKKKIKKITTI